MSSLVLKVIRVSAIVLLLSSTAVVVGAQVPVSTTAHVEQLPEADTPTEAALPEVEADAGSTLPEVDSPEVVADESKIGVAADWCYIACLQTRAECLIPCGQDGVCIEHCIDEFNDCRNFCPPA